MGSIRELELGAQHGEQRAQLVARVRHEHALALERSLDPIEHPVQCLAEPVDLVLGARKRQPLSASLERDLVRLSSHVVDRRQRAAGEQVAEARGDQKGEWSADRERARDPGEGLVAITGRGPGDDHVSLRERRRLGQDPRLGVETGTSRSTTRGPSVAWSTWAGSIAGPVRCCCVEATTLPFGVRMGEPLLALEQAARELRWPAFGTGKERLHVVDTGLQPVVERLGELAGDAQVDEQPASASTSRSAAANAAVSFARIDSPEHHALAQPVPGAAHGLDARRRTAGRSSRAGSARTRRPR